MFGRILLFIILYFLLMSLIKKIIRYYRISKMHSQQIRDKSKNSQVKPEDAEDADYEILDD